MNIRAEFEQEKGGRWVATIPEVPGVVGYGSTRHEAAVGLTVSGLHVLADRIKVEGGQLEAEDEPARILLASATVDRLSAILAGLLLGLESGHTPPPDMLRAWFKERDPNLKKIEDEVFSSYHKTFKRLARR